MAFSSTPTSVPAPHRERLRDGFSLIVMLDGETALAQTASPTLVLACPLGPQRDAMVGLFAARGHHLSAGIGGTVFVAIETALLRGILGPDFACLPSRAANVVGCGLETIPRTAELTLAAHAIRRCTHSGAIRNVFLKSKALEMLALAFGALGVDAAASDPISARDTRALMRARDLLLSRLDDSPRLDELAAEAGMCTTRLKKGFKRLFGDTPAGVARRARMAAARELLVVGRCRVSEAAAAVGYTNVSHFIDAFSREYGVRPGILVRMAGCDETSPLSGVTGLDASDASAMFR